MYPNIEYPSEPMDFNNLFLCAGHTENGGEGAVNQNTKESENDITIPIVEEVKKRIEKTIKTQIIPTEYTLQQKIGFTIKNADTQRRDFVLECHLNSSQERKEKGAMMYFYGGNKESERIANLFLNSYCKETGIKNTGVRPDTSSRFGKLGIIRDTSGWAFLLEMGSINNESELVKEKGVDGIIAGLEAVYDVKLLDKKKEEIKLTLEYLNEKIEELNKKLKSHKQYDPHC